MAFLRRWLHVAIVGDEWTDRVVRLLSALAAGIIAWFLQPVDVTVTLGSSVFWMKGLPLGTPVVVLVVVPWLSYSAGVAWVTSRGPRLRVDDKLLVDLATPNHLAYFRLRVWNDGSGVASPEVRVVKVVFADGTPAANEAQLPLTLPWSSLGGSAPRLTRNQKYGETVGVLGVLQPNAMSRLTLYVPGTHHHLVINWEQQEGSRAFYIPPRGRRVHIQVEAILLEYEHIPPIDRWFSLDHDETEASRFRVAAEAAPIPSGGTNVPS